MEKFTKLVILLGAFFILVGMGASMCSNCDQTYSRPVTQGTVVHLEGPASSPQGRTLDYLWAAYDCNSGAVIDLYYTGGKLGSGDYDNRDLYFYMPPAGDYRIALTVRDHVFPSTCYDTKAICFTTTFTCPIMCCGEVCEGDTPDYTKCPWHMAYTGPTGNYVFKWLIDGTVYTSGTGDAARSVNIDWTKSQLTGEGDVTIPLGYGPHSIDFELFVINPDTGVQEEAGDCDDSCTCPTNIQGQLIPGYCTIYKVQKPTAEITPTVG